MTNNTDKINNHLEQLVEYYQKANVQLKRDVRELRKDVYEYQKTIQALKGANDA